MLLSTSMRRTFGSSKLILPLISMACAQVLAGAQHAALAQVASLFKDIRVGGTGSSPRDLTVVNGMLFFSASDGVNGVELWKTDGTAHGTALVRDIRDGGAGSSPDTFTDMNGLLFFVANDGVNGEELWKSDGTATGTVLVKDIHVGGNSSSPTNLTVVNGVLFFSASNGVNGVELWKSDGTASGTVLVKDIRAGGNSSPSDLTDFHGVLYFSANDGLIGKELWRSDGTFEGTRLVTDVLPGPVGGTYGSFTLSGTDELYFSGLSPTDSNLFALWKTNGAGTVLVYDNILARFLTTVGDRLFFNGDEQNFFGVGSELWTSNGTPQSTALVLEIREGNQYSFPTDLMNVGGTLFFAATDDTHGRELWKSDGSAGGTVLVKDIRPGTSSSTPDTPTNVNGVLYFSARDLGGLTRLWISDGTASGTVPVTFAPGDEGAFVPGALVELYECWYFAAVHPIYGSELYRIDLSPGCGMDLSGNAVVDADDIFAFLNIWFAGPPGGTCSGCQADWDNSGTIDADDIFAYLADWFAFGPGTPCP